MRKVVYTINTIKKKERKGKVMKMMTYTIMITTDKKIYNEHYYGLIETLCRASDIVRCDNVIELDIVDNSTGEIIYNEKKGNLPYIATALIEELYAEC